MRRQKQLGLSTFIGQRTQLADKRLQLPSSNITFIDQVNPYIANQTESLNLHSNRLTSLKGIEQFSFLKELDISQNKIHNCEELARLKQLYHLKKLYLSNNPFLNQPIPESILDFIIDKDTDIQILSFQILSTLKDVEEREIKIIFLKNYIQKIGMHNQMKERKKVAYQKTAVEADQILNKIVPQFYTLIEDPKLINKIKREAIDKKKHSQETMEDVLEVAKHQKEQKIDQLVKNIVGLLHENEDFKKSRSFMLEVNLNDNTISFSPEKRKGLRDCNISLESQQFSPVKYIEMSKDDASIEEISLNTKQISISDHKYHQDTLQIFNSNKSPEKSNLDNLQTARKDSNVKSFSDKMREHTAQKQNVHSQVKKIKERESLQRSKVQIQHTETKDIQSSQKKSFDMSKLKKNLNFSHNNFIKVIEENQQEQSQENKSSQQQKDLLKTNAYTLNIPKNALPSPINQSSIVYNDQMSPQTIELIYFKTLTKVNPMFSLLHSPSNSLNNEEKNELLEALKVDHKEKFIELLKEKYSSQQLMRQLQQAKSDHAKEVQKIVTNNKNIYDQYLVYKEQFQWIDQRQKSIQERNQALGKLLKQTEGSDKKKSTALGLLETNFMKLKDAYAQKHERLVFLDNAEDREQIIRQKRQKIILKKYLKQLTHKANIWSRVLKHSQKVVKNREKLLLQWGIDSFIFNRFQQKAIKAQIQQNQLNVLKQNIKNWKEYKQLEKKEKKCDAWILQRRSLQLIGILKRNQASSKMKKLKDIWANRFLTQKLKKKSIKGWKILKTYAQIKLAKSMNHVKMSISSKVFTSLRQVHIDRKRYVQAIYDRRTERLIYEQFKRMIFIMRKETAEIDQKYRQTASKREQMQRTACLKALSARTKDNIDQKAKKKMLTKHLILKNLLVFKKIHKSIKRKLNKLSTFCKYLNFGVSIKMMKREKASNDYMSLLSKRKTIQFFKQLRSNYQRQNLFNKSQQKMSLICAGKLQFQKLQFLKRLQVFKLQGKNYVKQRTLQQLSHQMQLNDQNTFNLVRNQQEEVGRCQQQIQFLKSQIQGQSIREMALLREKDELMLSINQSYEIMMELRKEVDIIRADYGEQEQKYNALVVMYNESVAALQKKEKEYERLYENIKDQRLKTRISK